MGMPCVTTQKRLHEREGMTLPIQIPPPLPPEPGKGRILHSPGSSVVSYPKFQQEARKQTGSLLVGFCVYFSHGITKTTTTTATNEQALFAKLFRIAVKLQNHLNLIGSQLPSLLTLNRHMQCM